MSISDEKLAQQSLISKDTFAKLVDRYETKLLRYIKRLTGLPTDQAEDVLQETFIKIYRNLNNFDPKLKFSSWAYRITHNESINHAKKIKKVVPLENDDEDATSLIEILESDANVEKEAIQKETALKVRAALYKLPKKYRDVLILYYLEDQDYAAISDILKKPSGTVATLLNRAKAKFKHIYND
ncbi:RNA polymerase sigma factor [Patescibacteria group bacterium]